MADKLHIWNAKALAIALRNNEISDTTLVKHFIVYSMLFSTIAMFPFGSPLEVPTSAKIAQSILEFGLYAVIVYYGTWYTYQINSKGDGQFFFRRFFALTLPISIRLVAFGGLIFVAFATLLTTIGNALGTPSFGMGSQGVLNSIASIIWSLAFYFLMGSHIEIASGNEAS